MIQIFLLTTMASCLLSCKKDYLNEVNDNSTLIRQDYVVDLKTTSEFALGIYIKLSLNLDASLIYPDLAADNLKPIGNSPLSALYKWQQQPDESSSSGVRPETGNLNGVSYNAYGAIRSCNFVIEKANEFEKENPALAASLLGQAYGLRAFLHLFLVNYFAQQVNFTSDGSHRGIAYITSSKWTDQGTRLPVKEVYRLAIQDLDRALALPISPTKPIYFTKTAALALLARAYLNTGQLQNAISRSREVIAVKPLMLAGYPNNLFTSNDTEAIFSSPPAAAGANYSVLFPSFYFREFISFEATADIADLLTESATDKRSVWVNKTAVGGWNVVKFPQNAFTSDDFPSNLYYVPLIRSSEMYLIAAESYAKLNRPDSAVFFLDQVRQRADVNAGATTVMGAELLNAVYKERRKELAFEGFRMFDLMRWKLPVKREDAVAGSPKELSYPNDKAIAPIPLLDVKSSGLDQNDGY